MTYYDRIIEVLSEVNQPIELDSIMNRMEIAKHKQIYVIAGLKKGIIIGTIIKHETPNIKTKYAGHRYCLRINVS